MAITLARLFDIQRWRRLGPYIRTMLAYQRGDFGIALKEYDQVLRHAPLRTTERMAFLAKLMILNRKHPKEYLSVLKRVVAGEFRDDEGSPYAKAYAQYYLAFLLNQPDVMKSPVPRAPTRPGSTLPTSNCSTSPARNTPTPMAMATPRATLAWVASPSSSTSTAIR